MAYSSNSVYAEAFTSQPLSAKWHIYKLRFIKGHLDILDIVQHSSYIVL